jgi:hypothetical protein
MVVGRGVHFRMYDLSVCPIPRSDVAVCRMLLPATDLGSPNTTHGHDPPTTIVLTRVKNVNVWKKE